MTPRTPPTAAFLLDGVPVVTRTLRIRLTLQFWFAGLDTGFIEHAFWDTVIQTGLRLFRTDGSDVPLAFDYDAFR